MASAKKKASSSKKATKKVAGKQVKKPVKKSVKKPATSLPKKKVTKVSSSKKAVKKVAGKAVNKSSRSQKSATQPKKERMINICSACSSPYLRSDLVGGKLLHTCLRCGYKSVDVSSAKYSQVKVQLEKKKGDLRLDHAQRRIPHVKMMRHFAHRFPVRLWFGLFGMILFVVGIILVTSPERLTAGVLLVLGGIMAYLGEKL